MSILSATATFTSKISDGRTAIAQLGILLKIEAAVKRSQKIVVEHAQQLAPVVTGELRESIRAIDPEDTLKEIVGRVVAEANHAGFVEFGTGIRGAGTYPWELPKEGVPYTQGWVYDYKRQNWIGMAARPYMRPALDTARGEVLGEFKS